MGEKPGAPVAAGHIAGYRSRPLMALAFLVPAAYLIVIFVAQPPDSLQGYSGTPPRRHRLLADDYDLTAYALRGLNAALGRVPGLLTHPPQLTEQDFAWALSVPRDIRAAGEPYFLEYPVTALWLFRLGFLVGPPLDAAALPAALLNGWHNNVVEHRPANRSQQQLWQRLRAAIRVYQAIGALCLIGLMLTLSQGYAPGRRLAGPVWLLVLPASLYFSVNRFDIVPALFVGLSLAGLGRGRLLLSGSSLAAAAALKLYPILLVPIIVRFLANRHAVSRWLLGFLAMAAVALAPALIQFGWRGTFAPVLYQFSRTNDPFDMTLYGNVLPAALAADPVMGPLFRLGLLITSVILAIYTPPLNLESVLRRSAVVLLIFTAIQTVYSPQWILWILPLLLPLVSIQPLIGWLVVALDLVTYLTFPVVSDLLGHPHWSLWLSELLALRLAIVGALAVISIKADMTHGSLRPLSRHAADQVRALPSQPKT